MVVSCNSTSSSKIPFDNGEYVIIGTSSMDKLHSLLAASLANYKSSTKIVKINL